MSWDLLYRTVKSSVPPRRPDFLRRQRLLDFLHEHIYRELILLSAAAGYGKSSLVADFAHDTDYSVVWYQLDRVSCDLAWLLTDLVEALQRSFPHFESIIPSRVSEPLVKPADLAVVLNREISTAVDEEFILVLDDFHLVERSEAVMRFFDALLADLPEQVHLIVVGRSTPPLRVAPDQIATLSEEHLRFAPDEVEALVKLRKQPSMARADVEELVARTEGWITGIVLSTHTVWRGLIANVINTQQSHTLLYEYLTDEVLDQQPETLRSFLLESAVLPEMNSDMCNEILDISNGAALLRQAMAQRLFLDIIVEERGVYRYHNLFREFLLARLHSEDRERMKQIETQAAEWYTANDMPGIAINFYIKARQLKKAARVAEKNAKKMFRAGRYLTLRQWAEQLESVSNEAPQFFLYLANANTNEGELGAAETNLTIATAGFEHRGDAVGVLAVQIYHSYVLYRQGEFERSLAMTQTAYPRVRQLNESRLEAQVLRYMGIAEFALGQLAPAEESLQRALRLTQSQYDLGLTLNDLSLVLRMRGKTEVAIHTQQQSLKIWRELGVPGQLCLALNNTGFDQYLLGRYKAALATYSEALERARQVGSSYVEALVLAGQADLYADLDDRALAATIYREALVTAELVGDWSLTSHLYCAMAKLERWVFNFYGALDWLRRAEELSGQGQGTTLHANLSGQRGITLVEMSRVQEGRESLKQTCIELERMGASVDLAQTLFMRARAEFIDGALEIAVQSLSESFAIVEDVGYDQMLIGEAIMARDMLEVLRQHPDIGPRVTDLLAKIDHATSSCAQFVHTDPIDTI